MANSAISKVQINVPELPLKDMDLSNTHLTTSNFMQLNVAAYQHVPKGKVDAVIKSFTRLFPMVKPVLGSAKLNVNAFWVPYRVVWRPWTAFITDAPYNNDNGTSIMPFAPYILNSNLLKFFSSTICSRTATTAESAAGAYDFTNSGTNYVLNSYGRWAMKFLMSIGITPIFGSNTDVPFCSLGILCVMKAYIDWYFPSQFAHYGVYATLEGYLNRDWSWGMTDGELDNILSSIRYVAYDDDLFINGFENPVGGVNGTFSTDFVIKDISSFNVQQSSSVHFDGISASVYNKQGTPNTNNPTMSVEGTPFIGTDVFSDREGPTLRNQYPPITEFSLHSLMALNDYITRMQLAGSREIDRYLARYGKELDAAKLQRSIYLGSNKVPVEFSEVTSTADTAGANLGDYSGKGSISDFGSSFNMETDEYGMFLVLASLVPDVMYYQGIDQHNLHRTRLDFHTAEFDQLGNTALRVANVGVSLKNNTFNRDVYNTISLFVPRYFEYKSKVDHIDGDFRCDSINGGLMAMSTARDLGVDSMNAASDLVHSLDFVLGKDAAQFNRMFYAHDENDESNEKEVDNFYIIFRNNLHCAYPVKSLYDSYDWHSDTNKEIKLDLNGAKVN